MKLTFTSFPKFNFRNLNLKEIRFSNFQKTQKNANFIFQKINFLNYTFHTRILSKQHKDDLKYPENLPFIKNKVI